MVNSTDKRSVRWAEVDAIIDRIENRRKNGEEPYEFPIDEYVDTMFNANSTTKVKEEWN